MDSQSPLARKAPAPPPKPQALASNRLKPPANELRSPPLPRRPTASVPDVRNGSRAEAQGDNNSPSVAGHVFGAIRTSARQAGSTFASAGGLVQQGASGTADLLKKGWNQTTEVVADTEVGVFFKSVGSDIRDTGRKLAQRDSLCEQCSQLPVAVCWLGGPDSETLTWSTPLMRLVGNHEWCRLCRLLLGMLCRPGNDPLDHPEVRRFLPEAIRNFSMAEWSSKGTFFADDTWPFGRCEEPDDKATYILGDIGEGLRRLVTDKDRALGLAKSATSLAALANGSRVPKRTYADGRRTGRVIERNKHERLLRFRRNCDIQVTLFTRSSAEFPGLAMARCIGQENRPDSEPRVLSSFRLRVAHPEIRSNLENPELELNYGFCLDRNWIDLSVLRMWLWECELKHGTQCSRHGWDIAMRRPEYLRVIDVQRMCIIKHHGHSACRYIALSYRWGSGPMLKLKYNNMSALMQDGSLRRAIDMIPRTILDAMEVVLTLGERYLWVDALCKLQEESEEAAAETASMDRIYGSALATIVAATGEDANSGLRGVERKECAPTNGIPRNIEQPSAEVNGAHIITPFDCSQNLDTTAWNSRGWTFQEKLLSRRLIVFSDNEVVWYCRRLTCREDMRDDDSGGRVPKLDWLNLKPQWFDQKKPGQVQWVDGSLEVDRFRRTHVVRSGTFAEYAKVVVQYTRRNLTHNSDILFALEGLLNIFEQSFGSTFLCGLPESLFDIALLWRPLQQLERRICANGSKFPSWSWSGWEGGVFYDNPLLVRRDSDGAALSYTREVSGEEGVRPLLKWYTCDIKTGELRPVNGHGRGVPVADEKLPKEWEGDPFIEGQPAIAGPLTGQLGLPQLIFRTSSVNSLHLTGTRLPTKQPPKGHSDGGGPSSRALSPKQFSVEDASGIIGTLTLDGKNDFRFDRDIHELVCISESHHLGAEDRDGQIQEFQDYIVMLVERQANLGAYERLGLGAVRKRSWRSANPKIKTIVLL